MSLPFPLPLTIAAYAVAWVALHLGCGYLAHLLPVDLFLPRGAIGRLLASRRWEAGGAAYRRVGLGRWKDRLPEAGGFYAGGFSKRRLGAVTLELLRRFEVETNRAEFSHWPTFASSLTFFAWNPWQVGLAMIGYALLTNLPFILVQRFNRPRLAALTARIARTGARRPPGAGPVKSDSIAAANRCGRVRREIQYCRRERGNCIESRGEPAAQTGRSS